MIRRFLMSYDDKDRNSKGIVKVKVKYQTIRAEIRGVLQIPPPKDGQWFNSLDNSNYYDMTLDNGTFLSIRTCSAPEWVTMSDPPFYLLYGQGHYPDRDNEILEIKAEEFEAYMKPVVLAYNQEFSNNTLTYEDVFTKEVLD